MKRSVNTRIIFGFCCAISLVLAVGILSHFTFKQQTNEAVLVKHTYKVLNQLEFIQKLLLDMETGRRGFRATNDKRFLAPYTEARARFTGAMETLTELTIDNQGQQQRIQQLKADIYNIDTLWQNINTDEIYRTDAERLRVTNREKILMDIIRKDMGGIIDTEQALLARREKENNTAVTRANLAIATGTVLILVVVISMIVVIIGELRNRKKAQKALEDNFRELDEINKVTNEKNWLLTGVSSINNSIQDIQDLNALAGSCLTAITNYLKLPAAALYLYEEDLKQFQLRATIGLPTQKPLSGFRIGEGLAGHAATSKGISLVTDIPADFWQLQAASGAALPETILYVPLWLEQKLIGLIELCSFTAVAGQQSTLMTEAANAIAMALNAASANEKIYRLLSQVQEQKEELEAQQEELRQSNEELLRQSEVLQASEEELRVQGEELRQVNLEMERKNDAIEASRQALTIKARELEQSSRYKSEFLANMSHELRTPLNSVLILAKLLSDNKTGNLNAKQTEYAQIIHKSGTDLLNLINDILDLSKIEAGKIDMLFEEVPFNDIAGDLKQLFRVVADEKKINFSVNLGTDLPAAIHTDKQRLEQIIKNLLSNAFKFTPKNGNIEVSFFKQSAQRCGIAVKDSGIGIPADKQQVIFEAFRQADGTTNRKYGGTGLGLSISKELVRKLGGELQLSSVPDKGSTFSIYLPFHYEGNAAEETPAPTVTIAAPVTELQYQSPEHITLQEEVADDRDLIQKGDPVILIVEDDKHFAAIVRDFARSKHYKTVVALQGDEGLYYVHHYRPAAIILDLHLPVVDGKTILQTLKNTAGLSGIPVHVISSEDTTKSELVHARHFIRKPVAEADLEAMFLDINGLIRLQFKKILVISDEHLLNGQILNALGNERHPGIGYDHITGYNNFRKQQGLDAYDCVILDIRTDIGGGIGCLQSIRELMGNTIPVIAFLETDISTAEETQLNKYANTVIRNTRMAGDRLLDEMELFLYKIGEVKHQPLARMPVSGSDKSLKGKKVLLADDDMRNVFALSSMLEDEEMEIVTAADGREALEQLRNNPDTDIVLMDIMMPEMDGYEAMEQIRADKTFRSSLPVIALTAKAMEQDREKCIRHGASDYITKPVDNEKLLSLMRVWLAE